MRAWAAVTSPMAPTRGPMTRCFFHCWWTRPSGMGSSPIRGCTARGYGSTRTGSIPEDRIANWCRRLWALGKPPGERRGGTATHSMAEGTTLLSLPSEGWPATPLTADREALIKALRSLTASRHGHVPVVLVDVIWEVLDNLLPCAVRDDLANTVTPTHTEHFFSFLSILLELDVDDDAVDEASAELQRALQTYRRLRQTTTAGPISKDNPADATEELASDAVHYAQAKTKVMDCCLRLRRVGCPLYYSWLYHSAALSSGMRRLMGLRQTLQFFLGTAQRHEQSIREEGVSGRPQATDNGQDDAQRGAIGPRDPETERQMWAQRLRHLRVLDGALLTLFHELFSKEYLIMEELTWHSTPPSFLEQIMAVEQVHPFADGLHDMKKRLQPAYNRHLFAFLHPAVVEQPLIAVQVALTHGVAVSVDNILGRPTPLEDPRNVSLAAQRYQRMSRLHRSLSAGIDDVDTAIFYSINSTGSALQGLDMGCTLIKRVVREIEAGINSARQSKQQTAIHTFCTLSPIPGYVSWLATETEKLVARSRQEADGLRGTFTNACVFGLSLPTDVEDAYYSELEAAVRGYVERHPEALAAPCRGTSRYANRAWVLTQLVEWFLSPSAVQPWWWDATFTARIERPLLRSVASYLVEQKKRGHVLDRVCRFHISNGATMLGLRLLANATPQGSRESACVMVNYWYDMPNLSSRVLEYEASRVVSLGSEVQSILDEQWSAEHHANEDR